MDAGRGGMPSRLPRGLGERGRWRSDNETFWPGYLAQLVGMLGEKNTRLQFDDHRQRKPNKIVEKDVSSHCRDEGPSRQWLR